MSWPTQRKLQQKQIDDDQIDPARLKLTLDCLRAINERARGTSSILDPLRSWSANWPTDRPVRILDIGTGSADIPAAIAAWAIPQGRDVRIVAVDRNPAVLRLAAAYLRDSPHREKIQLLQADLFNLPFDDNAFDYCISSMALHQLPDIRLLTALRIMEKLARRGIIWSDMLRGFRSKLCVRLALLRSPADVRADALAAVNAGFTPDEVFEVRRRMGLGGLAFRRHLIYRFVLAGEWTGAWRLP